MTKLPHAANLINLKRQFDTEAYLFLEFNVLWGRSSRPNVLKRFFFLVDPTKLFSMKLITVVLFFLEAIVILISKNQF